MDKSEIEDLSDEQVEQLYSELLRDKMSRLEFLNWLCGWKDLSGIIREAEQNWSTEIKREQLYNYKDLL